MKKPGNSIIAVLLSLLLICLSGVQPGFSQEEKPVHYDLKTVETLRGIVVAAPAPPVKGGMPERAQLTLKTEKETLTVYLGPGWFVEKQGMRITNLDQLQVTGSRIKIQGKPALLAAEVRKGGQVLKLRNEQGQPLWRSGPGQ
jgi:hypothetical protein